MGGSWNATVPGPGLNLVELILKEFFYKKIGSCLGMILKASLEESLVRMAK